MAFIVRHMHLPSVLAAVAALVVVVALVALGYWWVALVLLLLGLVSGVRAARAGKPMIRDPTKH